MYNGYVESAAKIAARKARILKGYKAPKRVKKSQARKPSGSLEG